MRVRYTRTAAAELTAILEHIDERSPSGARNVKLRLQAVIDLLAIYPHVGRLTGRRDIRRALVHPYPYMVIYRVTDGEIIIHGIRHTARRPSGA